MSKVVAEGKTDEGVTIQLDLSSIISEMDKKIEERFKELKPKDEGKGIVESRLGSNVSKLIEELHNVSKENIKEQWIVTIPAYTTKELAGHLRDYVYVTEIIKGQPGDTVNVPYVKDFDFSVLAAVGDSISETAYSDIIGTTTTTLKEAGFWTDVPYHILEKIDQNLLDEINKAIARAAVRAEDKVLIELISALTSTNFAGDIGRKTGAQTFYAENIPKALGKLLAAGKDAKPGECILWINGKGYASLLKELVASNAFAYAAPETITKGMVEDYLGVRIVVGGEVESKPRTAGASTGTCELAFLFRPKKALILAPKRDILIETDRQISDRELRIAGSHTFGYKLLDYKEIVRIWCNTKSGDIT